MLDNLLSGPGLVLLICVGLIVLVAVVGYMAFNRSRRPTYRDQGYADPNYQDPNYQDPNSQDPNYQDPNYTQGQPRRGAYRPSSRPLPGTGRGSARPTQDDPNIRSSGGFGSQSSPRKSNRRRGGGGFGG